MKPEDLIKTVFTVAIVLIVALGALGMDASWVPDLTAKVLLWLLPGAVFAMFAEALASAVTDVLPRGLPATVTGAIWTAVYWGLRLHLFVTS